MQLFTFIESARNGYPSARMQALLSSSRKVSQYFKRSGYLSDSLAGSVLVYVVEPFQPKWTLNKQLFSSAFGNKSSVDLSSGYEEVEWHFATKNLTFRPKGRFYNATFNRPLSLLVTFYLYIYIYTRVLSRIA